ncbi:MAG TPA: hypothetical protein DD789_12025, partial [Firmicutes bacterium]|nr:hypothetical protein [Bacillota bacterium]
TGKMDEQTMIGLELVVGAGLTKTNIKEIRIDLGNYSIAAQVIDTARQYIGVVKSYMMGAKYDFEKNEYCTYYNVPSRYVFSEPTLDCSGFTHKVIKESANYELPHGSKNQRDKLGTQDRAIVGGLVFISPLPNGTINHILITTEIDEQGKPLRIIDSSDSVNGVKERDWPQSLDQRNPQYLKAPWLE